MAKSKSSAKEATLSPAKVNMVIRIISALGQLAQTFAGIFRRR